MSTYISIKTDDYSICENNEYDKKGNTSRVTNVSKETAINDFITRHDKIKDLLIREVSNINDYNIAIINLFSNSSCILKNISTIELSHREHNLNPKENNFNRLPSEQLSSISYRYKDSITKKDYAISVVSAFRNINNQIEKFITGLVSDTFSKSTDTTKALEMAAKSIYNYLEKYQINLDNSSIEEKFITISKWIHFTMLLARHYMCYPIIDDINLKMMLDKFNVIDNSAKNVEENTAKFVIYLKNIAKNNEDVIAASSNENSILTRQSKIDLQKKITLQKILKTDKEKTKKAIIKISS